MVALADSFDPWGPISVALYDVGNADFIESAVSATGLIGAWLMDLDPPTGSWVETGRYLCEDTLVRDACEAELSTTCLFSAVDHTKSVNPGEYVFVAIGEQPGITAGEFVYRHEGAACNGIVTRPRMGPTYRLHRDGLSGFDIVNIDEVNVLGRVVGRLGRVR
jgi:hypothetical protein